MLNSIKTLILLLTCLSLHANVLDTNTTPQEKLLVRHIYVNWCARWSSAVYEAPTSTMLYMMRSAGKDLRLTTRERRLLDWVERRAKSR